jgi:hypothetical protein
LLVFENATLLSSFLDFYFCCRVEGLNPDQALRVLRPVPKPAGSPDLNLPYLPVGFS